MVTCTSARVRPHALLPLPLPLAVQLQLVSATVLMIGSLRLTEARPANASAPHAMGHPALALFDLDPAYTNVNQGSYGSTPSMVRKATEALVLRAETNPDLWFRAGLNTSSVRGEST